ncbi:hypothetical protein DY000_02038220 [Brassica cretica]|uniref:Uncharacterized protein n=1 Tax=Brassica cretica TaxID=69181 RepID=A0ABQ7B8D4_BRACR|nr:hypothetical protein DY000_02038220 [Brassica cretica]
MNYTIKRFFSPSICEYPTLEEDSSPMKNRPEEKTIIGVKKSFSDFQKAQDQEKWPRILGVLINFTEPAKPTSSMESLQPIQLAAPEPIGSAGSLKMFSNPPGAIYGKIGQSFGLISSKPIFRFNLFQANQFRPEDIQTKPRPSEDIMHEPEEFYEFIPCTSDHWIRRILIYSNMPYLEQTDINVQQLFSPQIRHEIITYQAPRKIPRKLSYPLKPSNVQQKSSFSLGAKIP